MASEPTESATSTLAGENERVVRSCDFVLARLAEEREKLDTTIRVVKEARERAAGAVPPPPVFSPDLPR